MSPSRSASSRSASSRSASSRPSRPATTTRAAGPGRRRASAGALRPRRARLVLVVSVVFAGVVLATGLPVSALLTQRSQLAGTSARQSQLQREDAALSREVANLDNPSAVADVARSDYGFVPPGDTAYDVLPAPGSSPSLAALSGHVPLDGPPVAPGSRTSQQLLGAGSVPVTGSTSSGRGSGGSGGAGGGSTSAASKPGASAPSGSYLSRVLHTLEFWR